MERRLGRGLGSLLSEPNPSDVPREIELRAIRLNPFQPRRHFSPESLEGLRDSIRQHGILQPVVVRRATEGYELIAGERRWRSAGLAGLEKIPVVVRDEVSDEQMLELALVENVQRQDLDPIEKARGYRGMMKTLGLSQEDVAARVGLQRSTVANHIRLLDLPEPVREALAQAVVTMGHARALLGLPDKKSQLELLQVVVRKDLSVRETERLVRERVGPKQATPPATSGKGAAAKPPWAQDLERRMRDQWGTKVAIQPGKGERGQIVIDYFDRSTLERILAVLAPAPRV